MNYLTLLKGLWKMKRQKEYSRQQMLALQEERLRQILVHAYQHSPYYRQVFWEAGITDENIREKDITEFPAINKKVFMEHFDSLVTAQDVCQQELRDFDENVKEKQKLFRGKYHVVHSSGSTGLPAYFLYDDEAWTEMLLGIIRAALWNMGGWEILKLLIEKPRIMYIAATDGRYGGAMAVGDGIAGMHLKQLHLNVQSPLEEWIAQVIEFEPNMIIGYPSAVKILSELIRAGDMQLHITRVITCGEPLPDHMAKHFQKVFDCPVINVYGSSESLAMGVGATGEKGISLFDDLNYIEVCEDKIYLTCLYNFTQPVIRYEMTDELRYCWKDDESMIQEDKNHNVWQENSRFLKEQGMSPYTQVRTVLGRNEDLMWFEDDAGTKEFLHPLSVEGICVRGLRDYQFRKVNRKEFELYAEIDQLHEKKEQDRIRREVSMWLQNVLNEKKLQYVEFTVRFVDCIYPDERTGKKKLIT